MTSLHDFSPRPARRRLAIGLAGAAALVQLSACAGLGGLDMPIVKVVGLSPLPNEGLELRFALKLRVQNPNDTPIEFDGVAVELDLDGKGLASGVSDQRGQVPRYGELVVTVPVSISALSALRQVLSRIGAVERGGTAGGVVSYALQGKFGAAAGGFAAMRFSDRGEINLFAP
jgi:LEA14-like dessication related protein